MLHDGPEQHLIPGWRVPGRVAGAASMVEVFTPTTAVTTRTYPGCFEELRTATASAQLYRLGLPPEFVTPVPHAGRS